MVSPNLEDLNHWGFRVMDEESFQAARQLPASASDCPCQRGCACRRALNDNLDVHDDHCPWVRGDMVELTWQPASSKNLMRATNVCTTIVI